MLRVPGAALACAVCWVSDDKAATDPFNVSTLFLMAMPFTLVGSIGGWLFLKYRAAQGRQVWADIQQGLRRLLGRLGSRAGRAESLLRVGLVALLVILGGAGLWTLGKVGRGMWSGAAENGPAIPVYSVLPDFQLLERSGGPVGLSDLRGKVWVANLFFTRCKDACPVEIAELAKLQTEFAGEPDFRLVSISTDPKRDTPQVLAQYADKVGADRTRWLFLTGHQSTIYRLVQEGLKLSVDEGADRQSSLIDRKLPSQPDQQGLAGRTLRWLLGPTVAWAHDEQGAGPIHSTHFVLVDRQARIRGYFGSEEPEALWRLRQSIARVLRER